MIGFASKAMRADRDRVEFWSRVPGSELHLLDEVYSFRRETRPGDRRQPSPAPIPPMLAREAIAAGVPVVRSDDLFGRAA